MSETLVFRGKCVIFGHQTLPMKKIITLCLILCLQTTFATPKINPIVTNPYEAYFNKAYELYPNIPRGTLEAVAYTNTRFNHISHAAGEPGSCSGIPKAYGVMGLIADGKKYFKDNLKMVAKLSGYTEDEITSSPEKNILAWAAAYNHILETWQPHTITESDMAAGLTFLSELPHDNDAQKFALNTQLYSVLSFMNDAKMQTLYKFPAHNFDLVNLFGETNYKVLSSAHVTVSKQGVSDDKGNVFKNGYNLVQSADYGPALSAITSCNYASGRSQTISAVTIHDVEGSYAGAISWFNNCSAQVSAHYVVRSSDGQITQVVLESNTAWHVGSENAYTIGIEHEGYASQTGWYTVNMYTQSAALVRDICTDHSINPKRTLYQPWGSTTYYNQSGIPGGCTKIKGHQHYPNQTHTDPGPNWDWDYYYKLVNSPAPPATVYTTASGTFYDSGGSSGNYSDDEHLIWTISPAGASNVTLTFNNFNVENTWDYLYVYDGPNVWSPLIGYYTSTSNPGTLIASTGTMTIEFRSDCATNYAGWDASWTSNGSTITPANLSITTATCPHDSVTLKWANSGAGWYVDVTDDVTWTDYYNRAVPNATSVGCPGSFANITNTSQYLAFKPNTTYYWRVWDGTNHTYGNSFMTPSCIYQDTSCSGTFYDTGGPGGNYSGNEDYVSVFAPANATSFTMGFTSFDTEAGFDSMWVYNGASTAAPLLGIYTGTVSPGNLTANSGAMTVRFKADPFVNHAGWIATWNCVQNTTGLSQVANSAQLKIFPNPFNETITVSYVLDRNEEVNISLEDVLGREITSIKKPGTAGLHKEQVDLQGFSLTKGIYFLKLKAGNRVYCVKLLKD